MPLSFPASPTNGQQSLQNGRLYAWNGSNAWELVATVTGHASSHSSGGGDAISIDCSQVTSGTLADARLSTNVAFLASPTFTGIVTVPVGGPTAATVGIQAAGDPGTGIWFPGADQMSLATGSATRLSIDASGNVGISSAASSGSLHIGGAVTAGRSLGLSRNLTGSITAYGLLQQGFVQSDVTSVAIGCYNVMNVQATAFTLPSYTHFYASSNTLSGGAAVTTQTGFLASGLTQATNNFGFRGALGAATGRWNVYADGTAQNYFAGNVGIGSGKSVPAVALDVAGSIASSGAIGINTTSLTGYSLRCLKSITGATTSYVYTQEGTVQSDVTTACTAYISQMNTAAAAFTLPSYTHFSAVQGTVGANSAVTTQTGFLAHSTMSGATNNYGFRGLIASATGCWNLYMDGTAQNYLGGNLGIGSAASAPTAPLDVASDTIRIRTAKTPASATDTGTTGTVCWDSGYVYVCVGTNSWKRAALSTW